MRNTSRNDYLNKFAFVVCKFIPLTGELLKNIYISNTRTRGLNKNTNCAIGLLIKNQNFIFKFLLLNT